MSEARTAKLEIVDRNGTRGMLDLAATPPAGDKSQFVCVRFSNDAQVFVDSEKIVERKDGGGYFYPESFDEALLTQRRNKPAQSHAQAADRMNVTTGEQIVVPVVAEELSVSKRTVEQGMVRITKTVTEHVGTVDLPLMEEQTQVERVAVNRIIETAPPVRYEGDVMIVSLVEEVVVVEKRLMLREELRISKRQVETRKPQQVTLRREEATIERFRHDGSKIPE